LRSWWNCRLKNQAPFIVTKPEINCVKQYLLKTTNTCFLCLDIYETWKVITALT
jgi:hypothetical protein